MKYISVAQILDPDFLTEKIHKEYIKQLKDNNLFDSVFTDVGLNDEEIFMIINTLADKSENESLFVVPGFLRSDSVNKELQPQQVVQQCDLRIQGLEQIPVS